MKNIITLLVFFALLTSYTLKGQQLTGFASVTPLTSFPVTNNTGEKPQSKVWYYAGKYWAVMPDSDGTHIWRLDCTTWTKMLQISKATITKADCKANGNKVHILLFRISPAASQVISVEYVASKRTYRLSSDSSVPTDIVFEHGAKTATLDLDSKRRMWIASNDNKTVSVRWSDPPYSNVSAPIVLESGITDSDLCAVVALPGKIGVFWSNQNTRLFGFKTHTDGDSPLQWSKDEYPASQSALDIWLGMADDHMNFAVASDGTLYCATKTEYDTPGFPRLALLIRRPNGKWDDLYSVSESGTRPIVLLNEQLDLLKIVYTSAEYGGDILYRETQASKIEFSEPKTLITGKYNNATSTKANYKSGTVIMASTETMAVSVLVSDQEEEYSCILDGDDIETDFSVYPNPFIEYANLYFTLYEDMMYTVRLFDSKGSLVDVIKEGKAVAGERNVIHISAISIARGQYYISLETSNGTKTAKLIRELR